LFVIIIIIYSYSSQSAYNNTFIFLTGKIHGNDVVIFISHSGNTEEVVRALQLVQRKHVNILAILGSEGNILSDIKCFTKNSLVQCRCHYGNM